MTNKQLKKFLWQFIIYGGILAYLAADLFLFHGPLAQKIESKNPLSASSIAAAKARGVVARVYNRTISRSQVERAARERLWRIGQDYDEQSKGQRKLARYAALDELIDHELLRVKAMLNANDLIVDPSELDARVERFKQRFSSDKARLKAMRSQGIKDDQQLRDRIAAQMQREAFLELKVASAGDVTEEEAKDWFEKNRDKLVNPEHRKLRHIFLPSLTIEKAVAMDQLAGAKATLASGNSDFATLAKEISQDPSSRMEGGELGWVNRERLPEDFATAVWALPTGQVSLIESSIGWHLVEVMEQRPPQARSYEEARAEVISALRTAKRRHLIEKFRKDLRQFEAHRITVFKDMME